MKNFGILLIFFVVSLSGCDQTPRANKDEVIEEIIIRGHSGNFNTEIPQLTSPIRGVVNPTANGKLDVNEMEKGLVDIAKNFLEPENYIYSPGQVISAEEGTALVNREYSDEQLQEILLYDPNYVNVGINPILKDGDDPSDYKVYGETIIEQNYYNYNELGEKEMEIIAIGFGINPKYSYETKDGEVVIEITEKELDDYVIPYVSSRMREFLRNKEGYEDVHLLFGFFIQSESDIYPGSYYAYGDIPPEGKNLENVDKINGQYIVLPSIEASEFDSLLDQEVNTITEGITNYFSTASGVYGVGYYEEKQLDELKLYVTVNSYSSVDLEPFLNYLEPLITKNLSVNVDVIVEVISPTREAAALLIIEKNGKSTKYIY